MAINQLIAQGIRPIGADLPAIGQMLQQRKDAEQRNKLAELAAQTDAKNAEIYGQSLQAQTAARESATREQEATRAREWLTNAVTSVRQNPGLIPVLVREGKQRGILTPETPDALTPEQVEEFALANGIAPPEQAAPLAVQNVGGFRVLTQGGKPLPGGVQAPVREATGGVPGGRFGAPREGVNPETGNVEFFVTDNAGNVRWLGASGAAGKNTEARETAKDVVDARADVGRVTANARDMLNVLSQLERSQLGLIFGAASVAPTIPGTRQADAIALWEQVNGKAFLEAFNSLKGGGQITEKEGEKATAAITRLSNRKQSPKAAREAIRELREVVTAGVIRARRKAEGGQQAAPSGNVVDFNDL